MADDGECPRVALLTRREVASNRVWSVCLDHIRDRNGAEVPDYLTVIPKAERADMITGVGIVPLIGDEVVLLATYRHPVERIMWELPRGFVDAGEEPAAAALRELEEETGLLCDPASLVPLGRYYPEPSTIRGRGALFLARDCRPGGRMLADEVGLGAARRLAKAEVFAMLDRFEIEESGTAIALHRYRAIADRSCAVVRPVVIP